MFIKAGGGVKKKPAKLKEILQIKLTSFLLEISYQTATALIQTCAVQCDSHLPYVATQIN